MKLEISLLGRLLRARGLRPPAALRVGIALSSLMLALVACGPVLSPEERLQQALAAPELNEFDLATGEREVVFKGAINGKSMRDMLGALDEDRMRTLRVTSDGGLVGPAIIAARYIREHGVRVVADERCISACIFLMAASPEGTLVPRSIVVFHEPQPVVPPSSAKGQELNRRIIEKFREFLMELGLPRWAVEKTREREFWKPSIDEQIAMGLTDYILDDEDGALVRVRDYCRERPMPCARW